MPEVLDTTVEKKYWSQGAKVVAGIDEVGRGAWAGPLTVAVTIFSSNHQPIIGINDSKLLSSSIRAFLAQSISLQIKYFSLGSASVSYINRHGLTKAWTHAIESALRKLPTPDIILLDGKFKPALKTIPPTRVHPIIKGDSSCYSIASASILAKVHRDTYMVKLSKLYPHYHWHTNKGYGTTIHQQAILKHGSCHHHRSLFLRKLIRRVEPKARVMSSL